MFKKLCVLPLVMFSSISFAAITPIQQGGFKGPSSAPQLTVLQVQDAQDETLVSITGHIVSTQGDENYLFKDETGEIQVEIDNHLFQGQTVTPETIITIVGEVDKEWKQISIDADSLLINQ
ncbi:MULTISPECIES: YgiW/YdeI family stress tolerance OB fold protein [Shewanella]|uniref:NirD/YgiW/YdeI family stress tolerance protein n=1 Tax=Shewanella japonica TaxID=93973 RepID=A0ABM6JG06_9GAMM|nr:MULTISPECIES: NirD/YgiW/YdeI family stress tolerance protein [Shewanella]ARD20531.1 hypothetical protein SJ2017_0182 [Shewanella japonica]